MQTVQRGTIHDNPWQDVVLLRQADDDPDNNNNNNNNTQVRLQASQWQTIRPGRQQKQRTLTDYMLHTLVQICLVWDIVQCIVLLIYGILWVLENRFKDDDDDVASWPCWLALETALFLGLRILGVVAALYYSHLFELGGLLLASHVSVVMAIQTILLSILSAMYRRHMSSAHWWMQHFGRLLLFPAVDCLAWFLKHLQPYTWLLFLVVAVLEVPGKFGLYRLYRHRLLQQEEQDLQATMTLHAARQYRTPTGRPWWWTSHSYSNTTDADAASTTERRPSEFHTHSITDLDHPQTLQQALLSPAEFMDTEQQTTRVHNRNGLPGWARDDYHERRRRRQQQQQRQQASRGSGGGGFFSGLFSWPYHRNIGNRNDDDDDDGDNLRDDGSVDFASVQEEWASRSEEDPLWWSRDDQDHDGATTTTSTRNSTNPQDANGRVPDYVNTHMTNNNNNNNNNSVTKGGGGGSAAAS